MRDLRMWHYVLHRNGRFKIGMSMSMLVIGIALITDDDFLEISIGPFIFIWDARHENDSSMEHKRVE